MLQGEKRASSNPVPKLIDNKRKHLERQLSASQRDQLLINESKEDSQFKKDIAEAIRQSNETFAQSMQQMSMSMLQIAQGFTQSIEVLARAMVNKPSQPQYQYPPYIPADMSAQVRMQGQLTPGLTHHTKSRCTDMKTAKLGWKTLATSNFIPCKKELLLY